jgi:hypothetical protein
MWSVREWRRTGLSWPRRDSAGMSGTGFRRLVKDLWSLSRRVECLAGATGVSDVFMGAQTAETEGDVAGGMPDTVIDSGECDRHKLSSALPLQTCVGMRSSNRHRPTEDTGKRAEQTWRDTAQQTHHRHMLQDETGPLNTHTPRVIHLAQPKTSNQQSMHRLKHESTR